MDRPTAKPPNSPSSTDDLWVGLRRSSNYSFKCPRTSLVEVSSTLPPLYTLPPGSLSETSWSWLGVVVSKASQTLSTFKPLPKQHWGLQLTWPTDTSATSLPHSGWPPPCLRMAAMKGTNNLVATLTLKCQTWLPQTQCHHLRWDVVEALSELGFKDPSSKPSLNVLVSWVHPAFFFVIWSDSTTGGDQLQAQLTPSLKWQKKYGHKLNITTKSIISLQPSLSWCHMLLWTPLCLNMMFVMDKPGQVRKLNNRTQLWFRSKRLFLLSRCFS